MLRTSLGLALGLIAIVGISNCSSDDSNGTPAPANDAGGADTKASETGGQKETGPAEDAGETVCEPADVSGFTPPWKPPAAFGQNKCSPTQVEAYLNCLIEGTPDETTCEQVFTDNETCGECLITDIGANAWGPIIETTDSYISNVGGCIAHYTNDTAASSCGAKYGGSEHCLEEACGSVACPGEGDEVEAAREACLAKAEEEGCAASIAAGDCAETLLNPGGAAEKCNEGTDFLSSAISLGVLFCGQPVDDGGSDAPADG